MNQCIHQLNNAHCNSFIIFYYIIGDKSTGEKECTIISAKYRKFKNEQVFAGEMPSCTTCQSCLLGMEII